ncbi:hypothetical protein E2C01_084198 [Portunus trituberculatus]|uniref:Uncharacterized protein n=1 Tax=Portunus trituberculatus TaxID=210409 RepID=A0A5B7IUN4_PORTR|nr:hypothetical protein [Portunus trituberculatus]
MATSHSNKLSSLRSFTQKPSTGSSWSPLYSRDKARTALLEGCIAMALHPAPARSSYTQCCTCPSFSLLQHPLLLHLAALPSPFCNSPCVDTSSLFQRHSDAPPPPPPPSSTTINDRVAPTGRTSLCPHTRASPPPSHS